MTTPATNDLNTLMATFRNEFEKDQRFWNSPEGQEVATSPTAFVESGDRTPRKMAALAYEWDKVVEWRVMQLGIQEFCYARAPYQYDAFVRCSPAADLWEAAAAAGGPKFFARRISNAAMNALVKMAEATDSGAATTSEIGWTVQPLLDFGDEKASLLARKIIIGAEPDLPVKTLDNPSFKISSAFLYSSSDIFPEDMKDALRYEGGEPLELPCTSRSLELVQKMWEGVHFMVLLHSGYLQDPDHLKEGLVAADFLGSDVFPKKERLCYFLTRYFMPSIPVVDAKSSRGELVLLEPAKLRGFENKIVKEMQQGIAWLNAVDITVSLGEKTIRLLKMAGELPFHIIKVEAGKTNSESLIEVIRKRKTPFGLTLFTRRGYESLHTSEMLDVLTKCAENKNLRSVELRCYMWDPEATQKMTQILQENPHWEKVSILSDIRCGEESFAEVRPDIKFDSAEFQIDYWQMQHFLNDGVRWVDGQAFQRVTSQPPGLGLEASISKEKRWPWNPLSCGFLAQNPGDFNLPY